MKYLRWLFIPFLAILLMSHNTSALSFGGVNHPSYGHQYSSMVYYSLYPSEGWQTQYGNNNYGGLSFGISADSIQVRNINRFTLNFASGLNGHKNLVNIPYRVCWNYVPDVSSWIGFGSAYDSSIIENSFEFVSSSCLSGNVLLYNVGSNNVTLGGWNNGSVTGAFNNGFSIVFGMASVIYLSDDADYSSVLNAIKSNTDDIKTKLDELEAAAETQQEAAEKELESTENIENQSTSDINTGDQSSATNLIGNISNIFTQIGNISATNCSIRANFGNLDLGNLNLCTGKENLPFVVTFGAYCFELIFVVGTSIILIKQLLGILDWSRS